MIIRKRFEGRYPIVAAHRGASRIAPENTIASFTKALELGAKAIELDAQMTLDHEIVIIHDSTLDRTTSGQGPVGDKTLDELKRLDAGSWFGVDFAGEQIPTLDEVLSLLKGRAFVNIELKPRHLDDVGFEKRIVDIVRRHQMENDALVMSFDHASVQRAKRYAPDIAGLVITGGDARLASEIDYVKLISADGSNHSIRWWTSKEASQFHEAGLIVHGSLINDVDIWTRALDIGIDMVDSDNPQIYGDS